MAKTPEFEIKGTGFGTSSEEEVLERIAKGIRRKSKSYEDRMEEHRKNDRYIERAVDNAIYLALLGVAEEIEKAIKGRQ